MPESPPRPKTKKPADTPKPLEQSRRNMPKMTTDELLALIVMGLDDAVSRCWNYVPCEGETPNRDAINEGLVLAAKLGPFMPMFGQASTRHLEIQSDLMRCKDALQQAEEACSHAA